MNLIFNEKKLEYTFQMLFGIIISIITIKESEHLNLLGLYN